MTWSCALDLLHFRQVVPQLVDLPLGGLIVRRLHVAEQSREVGIQLGAALTPVQHVVNHFGLGIVHARLELVAAFDQARRRNPQ